MVILLNTGLIPTITENSQTFYLPNLTLTRDIPLTLGAPGGLFAPTQTPPTDFATYQPYTLLGSVTPSP